VEQQARHGDRLGEPQGRNGHRLTALDRLDAVDVTNPQSFNRYAYVMNNPMTLVDPFGLQGQCTPGTPNCPAPVSCTNMVCADNPSTFCGVPYCGYDPQGLNSEFDELGLQEIPVVVNTGIWVPPSPGTATLLESQFEWSGDQIVGGSTDVTLGVNRLPGYWLSLAVGNAFTFFGGDFSSSPQGESQAANNGPQQPQNPQPPQPSRLNQASKAALHTLVFGQAIGTGVGCGVGALVAAGATAATETYPLAGATVPAGCVGGGIIGFFEALPYSTLGAIADFGWTYWGH
jgi:hypothetical protein